MTVIERKIKPTLSRRKLLLFAGLGTIGSLTLGQERSSFGPVVEHILPESQSRLAVSPGGLKTGSFEYFLKMARGYFAKHPEGFAEEFLIGGFKFQVFLRAGPRLNLFVNMAVGQSNEKKPRGAFMTSVQDEKPVQGRIIESRWRDWQPQRMVVTDRNLLGENKLRPIHTWPY